MTLFQRPIASLVVYDRVRSCTYYSITKIELNKTITHFFYELDYTFYTGSVNGHFLGGIVAMLLEKECLPVLNSE